MLLAILLWLALVIGAVVFVLRLARGESHSGAFTESLKKRSDPKPAQDERTPRSAGMVPSFAPQSVLTRPVGDVPPEDPMERTMENPVYITNSTVVEMRSMRKPKHAVDDPARSGGVVGTVGASADRAASPSFPAASGSSNSSGSSGSSEDHPAGIDPNL
ncbi:hypothetical protein [Bifidobacterium vespertilionis]|uniref:Uncharacterized protein n=1 Tax=Bifidobacterium vespertilionis TaxID=2562524 RepID=A0A5J5E1A4_9BIFI|nr:hypothetical protein [Bifidobacterium vespertilionis]KAA8820981.1 hypothetical protein EMO90_05845 [Bifidobacterium vespertilionis]KAA8822803.1 hypothetical protein EM848_08100 [Bifidobacterium vespertilionis]